MKSWTAGLLCLPIILILGLILAWFQGYRLNMTPSVPIGLYRQLNEAPELGDLASFCLESTVFNTLAKDRGYLRPGSCASGLRPLLKKMAGRPGDLIGFTPEGLISVDGRILPHSAPVFVDSKGQLMPPSKLQPGSIPADQALLISPEDGGFDSRYFGLVSLHELRKVEPVMVVTSAKRK